MSGVSARSSSLMFTRERAEKDLFNPNILPLTGCLAPRPLLARSIATKIYADPRLIIDTNEHSGCRLAVLPSPRAVFGTQHASQLDSSCFSGAKLGIQRSFSTKPSAHVQLQESRNGEHAENSLFKNLDLDCDVYNADLFTWASRMHPDWW